MHLIVSLFAKLFLDKCSFLNFNFSVFFLCLALHNFSQKLKKETGILTGAVGLITTTTQAKGIVSDEQADLIILARQLLRDPYFALHAAKESGEDVAWPVQYERAKR